MNSTVSQVIDGGLQIVGVIVLVLGVAVFLLWKSMNRQIKKIDTNLPKGPAEERIEQDEKFTEEALERGEDESGNQ